VVTANRTGSEGELTFTGMSTIADPTGKVLAQAPCAGDKVTRITVDISLARSKNVTSRNNILADRRPEQYALLSEPDTG
jgi:predicted amidohydrolase